ncbi:MAG: hypothetical protein O2884_08590 [Chloroflexi bacterium]|nr:hypothetical protein [Chloroflexota bacterium]
MPLSRVQIANMALLHIGDSTIESLSEQSNEALRANIWFDNCVKEAFEAYDWSFARRRATLALHGDDAPETDWAYRYVLPSDCVMPLRLVNPSGKTADKTAFTVELDDDAAERTLLTDLEDAVLVYTREVTDPAFYSATFVAALSHLLAARLAYANTAKRTLASDQYGLYMSFLPLAAANNFNGETPDKPREAEWIRGRT